MVQIQGKTGSYIMRIEKNKRTKYSGSSEYIWRLIFYCLKIRFLSKLQHLIFVDPVCIDRGIVVTTSVW